MQDDIEAVGEWSTGNALNLNALNKSVHFYLSAFVKKVIDKMFWKYVKISMWENRI